MVMKLEWKGSLEELYDCSAPCGALVTSILVDGVHELLLPGLSMSTEHLGPLVGARQAEEWFDTICRCKGRPTAVTEMARKMGIDDDYLDKTVRRRHWMEYWLAPLKDGEGFLFRITDQGSLSPVIVEESVFFHIEWTGDVPFVMPCPNATAPA